VVAIPVPVGVPEVAVAVSVSTIVTPTTTMAHVFARSGGMGAVGHRVIDTDAATIEFLQSNEKG
jgi:hypothetical protein